MLAAYAEDPKLSGDYVCHAGYGNFYDIICAVGKILQRTPWSKEKLTYVTEHTLDSAIAEGQPGRHERKVFS